MNAEELCFTPATKLVSLFARNAVSPLEVMQAVLARIIEPGMDAAARDQLADTIDTFTDRRVARYWDLLGILNGWGRAPSQIEPFEWFIDALRAHG